MRVTGVDLSLASTGVTLATPTSLRCYTVGSKPDDGTIAGRSRRLRGMVTQLWPYVEGVDLVVIEQPSYDATGGKAHDRSGLWWMLVGRLTGAGVPVAEVTAGQLKIYATGKGRGSKQQIMAAVIRRHLEVEIADDNQADSLVLACMGLRALGQPYDPDLPQTHVRAMRAVRWPEKIGAAG